MSVVIEQPKHFSVSLELTGTSSLIQNNFSQKAVEEMLRKHMGLNVQREKKKPSDCLERATIRNVDNRVCIPPAAIKKAMLTAAMQVKGLKKTQLRTAIFVEGQSIPITFERMIPRMDMVRTSGMNRQPDVRFRPEFQGWKTRLTVVFSDFIGAQSVVDLLNRAGTVGVGEWRPEKDGTFGTFVVSRNIVSTKEIQEVRDGCACPLVPLRIPEWAMDVEIDPDLLQRIASSQDTHEWSDDESKAAVG
jgi:hypothetical protein